MMEALEIAPEIIDGTNPTPPVRNLTEIPYHLKKTTLRNIAKEEGFMPKLWNERGNHVEQRVQSIIATQSDIVRNVIKNEQFGIQDSLGRDLTVKLSDEYLIEEVYIQVKSSRYGIVDFKQAIRDSLPEGKRNMEEVHKWMTKQRIILINGSEEKSPEEILNDSFYPQLERIQTMVLREQNPENNLIQVFPEV